MTPDKAREVQQRRSQERIRGAVDTINEAIARTDDTALTVRAVVTSCLSQSDRTKVTLQFQEAGWDVVWKNQHGRDYTLPAVIYTLSPKPQKGEVRRCQTGMLWWRKTKYRIFDGQNWTPHTP